MSVRKPAVAGLFYPADPRELRDEVTRLLAEAEDAGPAPKAIIAPHAGYMYSGPVAATAYKALAKARGRIKRVVLLGPAHRVAVDGIATCSALYYETPLGKTPVDAKAVASIERLPQVQRSDAAHGPEHSLEVHVPFLQVTLGEFSLVPLVVGDASPAEVGEVLDQLWGGDETVIVASSDLSHYLPYEMARRIDASTTKSILGLHPEELGYDQACGRVPITGLLYVARKHRIEPHLVDLRNSGDTAGPKDRVVGYASFLFTAQ